MFSRADCWSLEFPNERACQGRAARNGKRAVILDGLFRRERKVIKRSAARFSDGDHRKPE